MKTYGDAGVPHARTALLLIGALLSLAVLVWALLQRPGAQVTAGAVAQEAEPNYESTKLDDDGRFTGPDGAWPPQPKGATDVVALDFGDLEAEQSTDLLEGDSQALGRMQAPAEVPVVDPRLQEALGEVNNLIGEDAIDGGSHAIYYSLSNNQTVEVVTVDGSIDSLQIHQPGDFQPELSLDEKLGAIELARAHWQQRRDARIDSLQGYTILAFQPGGAYYDTRMAYVSFHVDEDSRPELLTWVDLVTGEIIKSEVDR